MEFSGCKTRLGVYALVQLKLHALWRSTSSRDSTESLFKGLLRCGIRLCNTSCGYDP